MKEAITLLSIILLFNTNTEYFNQRVQRGWPGIYTQGRGTSSDKRLRTRIVR